MHTHTVIYKFTCTFTQWRRSMLALLLDILLHFCNAESLVPDGYSPNAVWMRRTRDSVWRAGKDVICEVGIGFVAGFLKRSMFLLKSWDALLVGILLVMEFGMCYKYHDCGWIFKWKKIWRHNVKSSLLDWFVKTYVANLTSCWGCYREELAIAYGNQKRICIVFWFERSYDFVFACMRVFLWVGDGWLVWVICNPPISGPVTCRSRAP